MRGGGSQFGASVVATRPRFGAVAPHLRAVGPSRRFHPVDPSASLDAIDPSVLTSLIEAGSALAQTAGTVTPDIMAARDARAQRELAERQAQQAARLEKQRIRAQQQIAIAHAQAQARRPAPPPPTGPSTNALIAFGAVGLIGLVMIGLIATGGKRAAPAQPYPYTPPRRNRRRR